MRSKLIRNFPVLFPREIHTLKSTRDLLVAGLTFMHLWPPWITPNRLSMARMFTSVFILFLLLNRLHTDALLLFAAGSICDLFDGPLARLRDGLRRPSKRLVGVSGLGSFLDPLADKTILLTVCGFALYMILGAPTQAVGFRVSEDTMFQQAYILLHIIALGTTSCLEIWSVVKRTSDYLKFRKGEYPIDQLKATNEGKWKAFLHFVACGGYVIAKPWSILIGLLLLTGSLVLTIRSLRSKYSKK